MKKKFQPGSVSWKKRDSLQLISNVFSSRSKKIRAGLYTYGEERELNECVVLQQPQSVYYNLSWQQVAWARTSAAAYAAEVLILCALAEMMTQVLLSSSWHKQSFLQHVLLKPVTAQWKF